MWRANKKNKKTKKIFEGSGTAIEHEWNASYQRGKKGSIEKLQNPLRSKSDEKDKVCEKTKTE